jgi:hypothetical protein
MLNWQPRRIVEFFPPDYWDSAFLFLAESLGIHDYHLWQIDAATSIDALAQRAATLMAEPPGAAGGRHREPGSSR